MSYGTGIAGVDWTLPEKEAIEQIKAAYALGINVSSSLLDPEFLSSTPPDVRHCKHLLGRRVRSHPRQGPQRYQHSTRVLRHHD